MSVLADLLEARPVTARPVPLRRGPGRPRGTRLRSITTPTTSVTVTITLGDPGSEEGARVLAALRDLVVAAGPDANIDLTPLDPRPSPGPGVAGLRLDPRPRTATFDGRPLDLSRLEYELLLFLAQHPRQVFSRSQLLGHVWGHTHTTVRTVDVHVSRLRTKLGNPDIVTTVYGVGYRLADDTSITVADA
ncbi:winged helix-turn-helix domain-containing protein [Actinoplanes friuliensis]|uniref:Putative transcriptional regulator n=1 Tax=Actinoplanes friuliensis DSM 7358 TaxID=1246995 RepID=U5W6M2_9ACTN|nr:winged helix-turn-helix domain-containing protein [Actinoplanes friuliensis]AGZ44804.1 putative transcriptional regulator [Actinoplanes friuliensis DSM 7358]